MSKRRGRPRRRWRLVLRFAAVALVAFLATAAGLSLLLSRRVLDRQRHAAESHAEFVAKVVLGAQLTQKDLAAPVRGSRYSDLVDFVKAEVLQPPLVLATVWRVDGTVIFSSERRFMSHKYLPAAGLQAAFQGISVNSVTYNVDKGPLFVPRLPDQVLDTYVPLFDPAAKPGAKPVAVAEVYTDYSAVTTPAWTLSKRNAEMVGEVMAILYLILIPVAWSIVQTVENQDERMELLLSRERSTQFERRRLLDRMLKATEEERTRLAAELHDGPVQRLARLGFGLERVRSRQKQGDVIGAERMLHDMQSSVFQEVKELRAMMSRLRPPVLDQRGLEDALRDRAEAIKADTGLECTVQAKLEGRLAPSLETVLYRVSQEALQNVVKHARAKHARVLLGRDDGAVVLEVQDDGVGFQPAEAKTDGGDHFGMLAMRERVEMIGGTCEVTSAPGKGTRVRVVLPWQGSQS
jgi:two-component system, NarL family, sensor kinase